MLTDDREYIAYKARMATIVAAVSCPRCKVPAGQA